MSWPRLDRAWTITVRVAFCLLMPLLLIMWAQEFGVWNVALGILGIFLIGLWRGWPSA